MSALDLSGQVFGRLTALSPTSKRNNRGCVVWKCKCSCGNFPLVATSKLKSGSVKSCGCIQTEYRDKYYRVRRWRFHMVNLRCREHGWTWHQDGNCIRCREFSAT